MIIILLLYIVFIIIIFIKKRKSIEKLVNINDYNVFINNYQQSNSDISYLIKKGLETKLFFDILSRKYINFKCNNIKLFKYVSYLNSYIYFNLPKQINLSSTTYDKYSLNIKNTLKNIMTDLNDMLRKSDILTSTYFLKIFIQFKMIENYFFYLFNIQYNNPTIINKNMDNSINKLTRVNMIASTPINTKTSTPINMIASMPVTSTSYNNLLDQSPIITSMTPILTNIPTTPTITPIPPIQEIITPTTPLTSKEPVFTNFFIQTPSDIITTPPVPSNYSSDQFITPTSIGKMFIPTVEYADIKSNISGVAWSNIYKFAPVNMSYYSIPKTSINLNVPVSVINNNVANNIVIDTIPDDVLKNNEKYLLNNNYYLQYLNKLNKLIFYYNNYYGLDYRLGFSKFSSLLKYYLVSYVNLL